MDYYSSSSTRRKKDVDNKFWDQYYKILQNVNQCICQISFNFYVCDKAGFWPNYGLSIHIPFAVKCNFKIQNLELSGYLGENWIEIYDPFSTVNSTFITMPRMIMIEISEQEETLKTY